MLIDYLYKKGLLKITADKVRRWTDMGNEQRLLFTLEYGMFNMRMVAIEGLVAINFPQLEEVLEEAIDDPVQSVSMLAIEALRKSTNDQRVQEKIEEKLRFWEQREEQMAWAASRSRSYPDFDGGRTKESPSSRLMSRLNEQRSDNHPPW
ncbi:MAG: hypothetical protein Roseis2KO_19570 [Roseivirga sp.]